MVVSLTATPMMCAHLLKQQQNARLDLSHQRAILSNWIVELRPDSERRAAASPRSRWRFCWPPSG
jgi:multidrug efflux pump subunit AcrB